MCKRQVGCLGRTRRKKRARTPRRLPRTGITYARRTNKNRDAQMCGHEGRGNNEEHLHKDAQHKSRDSPVKQTNKQTRTTARDKCRLSNLSWRLLYCRRSRTPPGPWRLAALTNFDHYQRAHANR